MRPAAATVEVCGQKRRRARRRRGLRLPRARNIGFIFQTFQPDSGPVRVRERRVPAAAGRPAGGRGARQRTLAMLEAVGLAAQARQRPQRAFGAGSASGWQSPRAPGQGPPSSFWRTKPTAKPRFGHRRLHHRADARACRSGRAPRSSSRPTIPQLMSHADQSFAIRDGELIDQRSGGGR